MIKYLSAFLLVVVSSCVSATGNEIRYPTNENLVVVPDGYNYKFTVSNGARLPKGQLVRESGEVLSAEQKGRLQALLDNGMGEYLNTKVAVVPNLNSGSLGWQTIGVQVVDMPSPLPIAQTVEVAYQANSHHNDSDSSTLVITPMQGGNKMGSSIFDTGYVNWRNYGGWFYMNTPYYTGTAVVPAGAEQIEFYSRCVRASNGGSYCTAGFGNVHLHFNKDLPSIGEALSVK